MWVSKTNLNVYPGDDDAGYRDLNARSLEQPVAQVHPVPERDHVPLNGDVVLAVQSKQTGGYPD